MRSGFKTFLLQISTIQQNIFGLRPTAKHTKITWVVAVLGFYVVNLSLSTYTFSYLSIPCHPKLYW